MARSVLIIGAGHNGLVCAWYLAKAGRRVTVLERRGVVGGAAVTEKFAPGFRNSTASYTLGLLDPAIGHEMALARHGLRVVERPYSNFLPSDPVSGDGRYLLMGGGRTREAIAAFSPADAECWPEYEHRLEAVAAILRTLADRPPPHAGDLFDALAQAWRLLKLPLQAKRDAIDLFTRSAREFLDGFFESDALKAVLGFDAIVGNYASPDTPASAYVLLHHVFGETNGKPGQWGHAIGGMGAVTQAMAAACREAGVKIRTDADVARVLSHDGRAAGIELASGEVLNADAVVANCHPKTLLLDLVDSADLDPATRRRMAQYKSGSGTFRMNVALKSLPSFTALPGHGDHLKSGIVLAPSLDYMARAYDDARAHGWSRAPIVEMLIPSLVDDSLAPPGHHVASLFAQHFDPALADWDANRDAAADAVIGTVEAFAPGFRNLIVGRIALSPRDLERRFGLIGGDIFHGRMSLDQLWTNRPLFGLASHRMPLDGLWLCGSGAHPGGGVSGRPGRNCAKAMLARRKPPLPH